MNKNQIESLYNFALAERKRALSGDLAVYNEIMRPQVGDLVVEKSISVLKDRIHIGFLLAVDYNGGNPIYHIMDVPTKKIIEYSNCEFTVVRGQNIYRHPDYAEVAKSAPLENKHA